jgi:signal transduction histidine kinase
MQASQAAEHRLSSDELPPATLPLPNGLAYTIAAISVAGGLTLVSAIATSGASWADALANHDLHNIDLAAVLGALVLRRRPGHVIGWVLVSVGAFEAVAVLSRAYRFFGLPHADAVDNQLAGFWVPGAACLIIALPQLFPDGRLLSRRWRPLAWFGVAATAFLMTVFLIDPTASGESLSSKYAVAFPLFGVASLASLVPLALRFRRSSGAQRQQFKWVFYGLAISLPMIALGAATVAGAGSPANAALTLIALELIPMAITVAILKFRLYDIDVVISKTLLVAGLTAFITVAYVAIVVGLGSIVGTRNEPNIALSVAATAVVAVAFQPVHRALQRVANRMVYGRRATLYDVLSGFATRIGAAEPSPDTLVHLAELMAGGTGADPARVWLRVGRQLRAAAAWPAQAGVDPPTPVDVDTAAATTLPEADLAVPVREHGELLGVLTIAKPRGERATEADTDLLDRLAAASGVLLRNLRLDAELTQRLADLDASRRRLVSAQDDARRRIEADLAGGSRARLTELRQRLSKLACDVNDDVAPKTALLVGQLVASTDGALKTLDGLAAGVYPPRLAAAGLGAALTEQATKAALPVSVHTVGIGRYSADVEAAAYFAVLEALQNVAKYAGATSAQVRLYQQRGYLHFEVADDGIGFDPAATGMGTGLQGIADRLDTVGGTMTIDSTPRAGTTVSGQIPADGAPGALPAEPAMAGAAR